MGKEKEKRMDPAGMKIHWDDRLGISGEGAGEETLPSPESALDGKDDCESPISCNEICESEEQDRGSLLLLSEADPEGVRESPPSEAELVMDDSEIEGCKSLEDFSTVGEKRVRSR